MGSRPQSSQPHFGATARHLWDRSADGEFEDSAIRAREVGRTKCNMQPSIRTSTSSSAELVAGVAGHEVEAFAKVPT
jgi:hypothetical protein